MSSEDAGFPVSSDESMPVDRGRCPNGEKKKRGHAIAWLENVGIGLDHRFGQI
jgi:hypothetical protein